MASLTHYPRLGGLQQWRPEFQVKLAAGSDCLRGSAGKSGPFSAFWVQIEAGAPWHCLTWGCIIPVSASVLGHFDSIKDPVCITRGDLLISVVTDTEEVFFH